MNLIFLYGPPAVGKLTVARELSEITGYKVFHNHLILNAIRVLFPFGDLHLDPIRKRLGRKFRREIFEEAAKANVDVITTFGMAGAKYFDFFEDTISAVESNGGKVLLVQLKTTKEELLKRVESESRKNHEKIHTKEDMKIMFQKHPDMLETFPNRVHITLDTTNVSPKEAADKIIEYYKLK